MLGRFSWASGAISGTRGAGSGRSGIAAAV